MTEKETQLRFSRMEKLVGAAGLTVLRQARIAVVGVGGVGSFVVEALARAGVGWLVLIDHDQVDLSNTNRQLHALTGNYGRPKVEVMAERVRAINPESIVVAWQILSEGNLPSCTATLLILSMPLIRSLPNRPHPVCIGTGDPRDFGDGCRK